MTPGARPVRAPHGTALTCGSWQTEAPLRCLMNNLDPAVAEDPDRLVVDANNVPVIDPGTGRQQILPKTATDHSTRLFVGGKHAFNKQVTFTLGAEYLQSVIKKLQDWLNGTSPSDSSSASSDSALDQAANSLSQAAAGSNG